MIGDHSAWQYAPDGQYANYMRWPTQPDCLVLPGIVTIHFDPPRVELAPGVSWDEASLAFWERVQALAGRAG